MLVTLEEVKAHLRIDHNEDDTDLNGIIAAATAIALGFTGDPTLTDLDPVPADLRYAILVGVAHMFDHAGETGLDPRDAMAPFLAPYRKWSF
ncbi:hypothetical protein DLJ53_27575 [Acuticoccus sediminis]|uniref:Phage gp6-like head-tail connector protein n=1 Tax=Acuticoccus sediminis TaxID=2184697 RepID=A0A8B2NF39_9HYPH|nr:head-tail connector protein [Acuticoccus sediminis]RAH97618.1 hypothetical protein DLJ53_27575 [Acuticoccus sediminis]